MENLIIWFCLPKTNTTTHSATHYTTYQLRFHLVSGVNTGVRHNELKRFVMLVSGIIKHSAAQIGGLRWRWGRDHHALKCWILNWPSTYPIWVLMQIHHSGKICIVTHYGGWAFPTSIYSEFLLLPHCWLSITTFHPLLSAAWYRLVNESYFMEVSSCGQGRWKGWGQDLGDGWGVREHEEGWRSCSWEDVWRAWMEELGRAFKAL